MLRRESTGLKNPFSMGLLFLSKLNPDLTKSLELFVEISVVTWRSLVCARRALARDLAPLPSEISTLGCFQEDVEVYYGVYIAEDVSADMAEDVRYAEDILEDVCDGGRGGYNSISRATQTVVLEFDIQGDSGDSFPC